MQEYNIDVRRDIIIVPNARNAAALVSRTRLQDPVCRRTGGVGRAARAYGGVYIVRRPSAAVDQWQPAAGERSVRFSPVSGAFYYYFCFLIFYFLPADVPATPTARRQRLPRRPSPSCPCVNPRCIRIKKYCNNIHHKMRGSYIPIDILCTQWCCTCVFIPLKYVYTC